MLNNTTTSGLAKVAAARFQAAGWTVSDTGNLTNDIVSTCAYYDPSADGAEAAAQALQPQFPTIKRVAPKFPELPERPGRGRAHPGLLVELAARAACAMIGGSFRGHNRTVSSSRGAEGPAR